MSAVEIYKARKVMLASGELECVCGCVFDSACKCAWFSERTYGDLFFKLHGEYPKAELPQ
jgi:hypothetical protein